MKIAVLNNLYPPYDKGGAEKIVQVQIKSLKEAGHELFIITTKNKKQIVPEKQNDKIYYINSLYNQLESLNPVFKLIWHLGQFFKPLKSSPITKILKKEKPDLLITHNIMGLGWRLPIILNKLKIKHHHYLHDIQLLHPSGLIFYNQENIINTPLAKIYQFFTRLSFRHCSEIISPSNWLLKLHQEKKIFKSAKSQLRRHYPVNNINIVWPNKIEKLLFIGQLEKHKGIIWLLDCLENLQKNHLTLSIIGHGSLKKTIEQRSQKNPNLNYLGRLNKEEIFLALSNHDCLIVPSFCYENSPTVIFEAAQAGTPVIASAIGGIPELKELFNLRLFKPGDQKSLKERLFSH